MGRPEDPLSGRGFQLSALTTSVVSGFAEVLAPRELVWDTGADVVLEPFGPQPTLTINTITTMTETWHIRTMTGLAQTVLLNE
jgi:hypothetical protein